MGILRSPQLLGEDGRSTSHSRRKPGRRLLLHRSGLISGVVRTLQAQAVTGDKMLKVVISLFVAYELK